MKKSDVETHNDRMYGNQYPAVNVKIYRQNSSPPMSHEVAEKFGCSEKQAEKALEFWFNMAQESFWENITDAIKEVYEKWHYSIEVYSAGRSGGWLIVKGLPEIETWDAAMLGKWGRVCKICRDAIRYHCSKEAVFEDIDANEWWKEGSEKFNVTYKDGEVTCIADLKKAARDAGFGDVVRA